jgi:tetratricopeptide (TPR) repeat protein
MIVEQMKTLRHHLYRADFKKALGFVTRSLFTQLKQRWDESLPLAEREAAVKLRNMVAEVLDYHGRISEAAEICLSHGSAVRLSMNQLIERNRPGPVNTEERQFLKQQIWALLHAGMAEYRAGNFDGARDSFQICDRACREFVVCPDDPAWGTRARIAYCLGLVFRETCEHSNALAYFSDSVEHGYKALYLREKLRSRELSRLSYVAIAKNLGLGLAYVYADIGRPDLAIPLLVSAKSILQSLPEVFISSYVDLIYANVLRAKSSIPLDLHDSISRLSNCYEIFTNQSHLPYRARASYYLAVALIHRARPDESLVASDNCSRDLDSAQRFADELKDYAAASGDRRFDLYRFVLNSRIQRKLDNLDKAAEWATFVIGDKKFVGKDGVFIEGLIAHGEARERSGDLRAALEDFHNALSVTRNPRVKAACLLHLSRIQSRSGNGREAARHLREFVEIKSSVTHVHIRNLEAQAREALERIGQDIFLRLTDDDIDAAAVEQRVRRFLVDWAKSRCSNDSDAARLLNVSRQTLYNWAKQLDSPSQ